MFLTLIAFIGFYFILRTILRVKATPKVLGKWNEKRKQKRSTKEINKGLIDSAEGNWQRSEKLLVKHAEQSDTPLLNYLSAAHAAQSQQAYNRRDEYLYRAGEVLPDQLHAIHLTRAKLQLAAGQFEQALASLLQLKAATPSHPIVLTLLMKTHQQLNEWEALYHLLPAIKNNRKIPQEEWQAIEKNTLIQLFKHPSNITQHDINTVWNSLDRKQKSDPDYLIPYVSYLIQKGEDKLAEKILLKELNTQTNEALLSLYIQLNISSDKKLQQLEKWRNKQTNSTELLNTLAHLCLEQQQWGKAKSYLDDSIALHPTGLAYLLLGQTYEQLGEPSELINASYKTGLELSVNKKAINAAAPAVAHT
ncbi:MAG: heme biosynthesis protein HemY [Cycloclasticus sp. Phe_18]|nr:MAG: heme biosynthesis protein HemY [Cycloclasticus sp. Phe_18]